MGKRILIYGSRTWVQTQAILYMLEQLEHGTIICTGGEPKGADTQAANLARHLGFDVVTFFYNSARGRRGGPYRNQLMLDIFRPDEAIGFRAEGLSPGTDDMTKKLHKADIPYKLVSPA